MSWNIQNLFKKCRLMRNRKKNGMKKKNSICNRKKFVHFLTVQSILAVTYVQFLSFIRIIQKFAAVISLSTVWLRAISFARIFRSAWIRMTLMLFFSHFFSRSRWLSDFSFHFDVAHILPFIQNLWYQQQHQQQQQLNGFQQSKHFSLNGLEFFFYCTCTYSGIFSPSLSWRDWVTDFLFMFQARHDVPFSNES